MKKTIRFLALISLIIFGITTDYNIGTDTRTNAEKIIETIVTVESGSGVIIHSEKDRAIVLTAYHVIEDSCEEGDCDTSTIHVTITESTIGDKYVINVISVFDVLLVDINIPNDLAILEIKTFRQYESAPLSRRKKTKYGDEVYIASNPNHLFRSLTKGIIGSPFRVMRSIPSFEFSGGIIFGSSGGGVFTTGGKLISIVQSVMVVGSPYCYDTWDSDGNHNGKECVKTPVTFLGFAVRPEIVREFIKSSVFCDDFNYQCIDSIGDKE